MHNFRKIRKIIIFTVLCIFVSSVFSFLLIPYSYTRVDIHNIEVNKYDDLYIGTSHGKCGINPLVVDQVTGGRSTNLCLGGEYLQDSYYLVKEAARNHKPKRIIYELDPGYWVVEPNQAVNYDVIYREIPFSMVKLEYYISKMLSADFRNTLFPWYTYRENYTSIPGIVKTKLSKEYREYGIEPFRGDFQSYEKEGFIHINELEGAQKSRDNLILWDRSKIYHGTLSYFCKLAKFCQDNRIELIVITTPIPEETLNEYSEHYADANEYFIKLMEQYNLEYYNFNYIKEEKIDRSMKAYSDYDGHMYGWAADKFSEILGRYLK